MNRLDATCSWRKSLALVVVCGISALLVCSLAYAGTNEAPATPGKPRSAAIDLRVLPGFGGRVEAARYQRERGRRSRFGIFRREISGANRPPLADAVLVWGSVRLNAGFANRLGSHVDIVVHDRKGRVVERIAARYLPNDLTIRARDPIGQRGYFAETLVTPPDAIRNIGVQYHHGPDLSGDNHL